MRRRTIRTGAGIFMLLLVLSCLWFPAVSARADSAETAAVMSIHHTCKECNQYFGENYLLCHENLTHEFRITVPEGYTADQISWKVTKEWIPDSNDPTNPRLQKEQPVAEGSGDTIRLAIDEEGWWNYYFTACILKNRMPVEEAERVTFRSVKAIYTNPAGPNTAGVTISRSVGETCDLAQEKVRRFTRENIASGGEIVTLGSVANGLKTFNGNGADVVSFSGTPVKNGIVTAYPGLAVTGKAEGSYHPWFIFGKNYYDNGFEDLTAIDIVFAGKAAEPEAKKTEKKAAVKVPAVKKLKVKAAKKKLTVTWKAAAKKAKVTGYQVSYRLKTAKKWTVKKVAASKNKLVIKKLKSGKKYLVRIRAMKKVGKKTYYGAYTKAKTVKVK